MYTVYHYPSCSTCKKALKWLNEQGIEVELKHIVLEHPSYEVMTEVYKKSGLPLKRFFNTSGQKYRELNMKEAQKDMTEEAILKLMAEEGMLIKRPLLLAEDFALVGFKEAEWVEKFC